MRCLCTGLVLLITASSRADEPGPKLVVKPDAFATLVNPNCSHCLDEAKRRGGELRENDRVLAWTRGQYDGGAIPLRFFLNPYRVISDTYGVFVYDPDAGYARGFAPSLDFTFHGWRNGVMVMKHKDGTLFSCLSGLAFDGPRRGEQLAPWTTALTDWGWYVKHYPGGVAYHMFEKYQPTELPTTPHPDAVASRGKPDPRLPAEEPVLGVDRPSERARPRAYRISDLEKLGAFGALNDRVETGQRMLVLWQASTRTATAYRPAAEKRAPTKQLGAEGELVESTAVQIEADGKSTDLPFADKHTGSRFDVLGRCRQGELKGWTLTAVDSVQVKWFAWAAEYEGTTVYKPKEAPREEPKPKEPSADKKPADTIKEVAGAAEFLRAVPKHFATLQAVDVAKHQVTLLIEGEKVPKVWPLTPDAEVKVLGWWGRVEDIPAGARVWVWLKTDRQKRPVAVFMLADEVSEQDIHGKTVTAANFEEKLAGQKKALRAHWEKEGLPGTLAFVHVYSGEMDLLLDHEAMRWGRALKTGDKVALDGISAAVKSVSPWRERTQVRLVINGLDAADFSTGQRVHLKVPVPPPEVEESPYPPDIDKARTKEERIDWFLANIYCTCKVGGDICTGHFYTLASCNPNGCAAPNATRKKIAEKIEQGLSDRQIFDDLRAERGPALVKPHLVP